MYEEEVGKGDDKDRSEYTSEVDRIEEHGTKAINRRVWQAQENR
jgi:hypothetical protein